jgi:hypothetical protein
MREALYVPDSRPADRVMDDLRRTRAQMSVVLDEYGGTAGIVTIEDLVEEIVGDISDEYDIQAREAVEVGGVLELAGDGDDAVAGRPGGAGGDGRVGEGPAVERDLGAHGPERELGEPAFEAPDALRVGQGGHAWFL